CLAMVVQLGVARRLTRGRTLRRRFVHGLRTLFVARLLLGPLVPDDTLVGMGHAVLSLVLVASSRLRAEAPKVPARATAALAMRRVHRCRRIFLMHLPHCCHRRERDRDAEGKDEREKSQTWSHCE